jgi:hypothetical protein
MLARCGHFSDEVLYGISMDNQTLVKMRIADEHDPIALRPQIFDWLMTNQGFDVLEVDAASFLSRDSWSPFNKSIAELLDDFAVELQMRSLAGKLAVLVKNMKSLFREDIGEEEKKTYRYVIASLQK